MQKGRFGVVPYCLCWTNRKIVLRFRGGTQCSGFGAETPLANQRQIARVLAIQHAATFALCGPTPESRRDAVLGAGFKMVAVGWKSTWLEIFPTGHIHRFGK